MVTSLEVVLSALLLAASTLAQTCNITSPCPASAPCCSEYGYCGSDTFCLGGCNPMASNMLTSCRPNPVCQSMTHTFADTSRILSNVTFYDGNATAHDWTLDQGTIFTTNASELILTLDQKNGGTRLSTTRFLHYGTVTATMKAGRWNGVVAAFITMSPIKDEIDWEWPGANLTTGQTNYFWQGYWPTPTNGETETGLTDVYANYHDYTIDWQPTYLKFSIDGNLVRTINQADVVKDGISRFPNTPARIQLSLWPAGIPSSAQGTIDWAGGMINWNDPDYLSAGHFYSFVKKVDVKCSDSAPSNATSYIYGANSTADTPTISFSNKSTLLSGALPIGLRGPQSLVFLSVSVILSILIAHLL